MIRQLLLIALVAAVAAGCASQQTSEEAAPSGTQTSASTQPAPGAQASSTEQPGTMQSGSQPMASTGSSGAATSSQGSGAMMSPSADRSIYYDFDKAIVKDEFRSVIESHGGYLSAHPGAKVTIEGNCDERGSREYNLALGQRRADSVKAKLKLLGASDAQIETISWGKEKPKAQGHNESAWAQNRRSDIVYTSQ